MTFISELRMIDLEYLFYFVLFYFLQFYFIQKKTKRDMMSHMIVTQVTKCDKGMTLITGWLHHITVIVTRLCNTEKVVEDSGTDDII